MIRKIIKIYEDKCNGCGLCVTTYHEGAIGMVNEKAKLILNLDYGKYICFKKFVPVSVLK